MKREPGLRAVAELLPSLYLYMYGTHSCPTKRPTSPQTRVQKVSNLVMRHSSREPLVQCVGGTSRAIPPMRILASLNAFAKPGCS